MNMFADDAKIMKCIKNLDSCIELQCGLDKLYSMNVASAGGWSEVPNNVMLYG